MGTPTSSCATRTWTRKGFFAATKPVYKQNDFGVTVGGPVWLPKIYNGRNRTFFFFSYEGFRNRVGASAHTLFRAAAGILHGRPAQLGELERQDDPDLRSVDHHAGERHLPADAVSEQPDSAVPIRSGGESDCELRAAARVTPNVPGLVPGTSAYVRNNAISYRHFPESEQQVQHQGRPGDHRRSRRSRSFSAARGNRIWVAATRTCTLPFPLSGNPGYNQSDVYRLSYDYTISPTLLNRFYAGGNNWRQNHGSYTTFSGAPQADGIPTQSTGWKSKGICIPNWPNCDLNFPIENFSNFDHLGRGRPERFGQYRRRIQGRHDQGSRLAHVQVGLLLQQHPLQWLRTDIHCREFENFSYLNTAIPLDTSQANRKRISRHSCWARRPATASIPCDTLPASTVLTRCIFRTTGACRRA